MNRARLVGGSAGALLGVTIFAASLVAIYIGMRDVMVEAGGYCATGGPYVIANECSEEQVLLSVGGFMGLMVGGFVFAGFAAWARLPLVGGLLLMWAALFGSLGWNFLELGFDPPGPADSAAGWIVCGVVFWAMALGGLLPGVFLTVRWVTRLDETDRSSPLLRGPLIRVVEGWDGRAANRFGTRGE